MQTFRKLITHLGGFPGMLILIIPLFFFPTAKYGVSLFQVNGGQDARLCFAFLCISLLFTLGIAALTKLLFYKPRPIPMEADTFRKKLNAGTFPSIHTAVVTIIAMMVFWGVTEFGMSTYIFLLYMIIVVAVALSRIVLKKHYPTDVLFGVIYGVVGVFTIIYGPVLLLSVFRIF